MGLQIRQELSSLGPILAFRRPKPDRLLDSLMAMFRSGQHPDGSPITAMPFASLKPLGR